MVAGIVSSSPSTFVPYASSLTVSPLFLMMSCARLTSLRTDAPTPIPTPFYGGRLQLVLCWRCLERGSRSPDGASVAGA